MRKSYYAQPEKWSAQKEELCAWMGKRERGEEASLDWDRIPLEVLLAYMVEKLDLTPSHLQDISLYPAGHPSKRRLILSKHEKGITPIPILLSLEVELSPKEEGLKPIFISLRRGSREVSPALAWIYFGPELQMLGCLQPIFKNSREGED